MGGYYRIPKNEKEAQHRTSALYESAAGALTTAEEAPQIQPPTHSFGKEKSSPGSGVSQLRKRKRKKKGTNTKNNKELNRLQYEQSHSPKSTGQVTAKTVGKNVQVKAPWISLDTQVNYISPTYRQLGPSKKIDVGPVQTLTKSLRKFIYRHPRTNQVTFEFWENCPPSRDATNTSVPAPWYSKPDKITRSKKDARVQFDDQPDTRVAKNWPDGSYLSEVRGEDRFILSVAGKQNADMKHLKSWEWSVPWNLNITKGAKKKASRGGAISINQSSKIPYIYSGAIPKQAFRNYLMVRDVAQSLKIFKHLTPKKHLKNRSARRLMGGYLFPNRRTRYRFYRGIKKLKNKR